VCDLLIVSHRCFTEYGTRYELIGLRIDSHFPFTPPTLTSARPPTQAWEVARTVVAPPSSVVKCLWGVFVWGFGVLFLSCVCVCVGVGGAVLCRCVCVCVCDLLIFLQSTAPGMSSSG